MKLLRRQTGEPNKGQMIVFYKYLLKGGMNYGELYLDILCALQPEEVVFKHSLHLTSKFKPLFSTLPCILIELFHQNEEQTCSLGSRAAQIQMAQSAGEKEM